MRKLRRDRRYVDIWLINFSPLTAYIRVISAYAPYELGGREGSVRIVLSEIPTESCVGAYNFALGHTTYVKFPDLGELTTGYRLVFEVKAYNLREWRYEQFFIASSLLLRREVCFPG